MERQTLIIIVVIIVLLVVVAFYMEDKKAKKDNGKPCAHNAECKSDRCVNKACQAAETSLTPAKRK